MRFSDEEKEIVRKLLAFERENNKGSDFLKELLFDDEDNKSDFAYLFWCYQRPKELVAILGGKKYHSILHKKLSVILFLNELAKERLITIIEPEGICSTEFFWGPYQYSCAYNDKVYFVPDGEPNTKEETDCYFDWKLSRWHPKYNGEVCVFTTETYQEDDVHIKKILNSRIFVSAQLKTLANNDFETVTDKSLKVSQGSFWISIAAFVVACIATCLTCISTCDTHSQINNAREQANSAVDISKRDSVALEDLKNFEVTTEGYLKRNDSIMSSILNILNKQPKNSGKQTSNSGKQPKNSDKQPKNSGKQTSNSDKQTSKKPNEKGLHK